MRIDLNENNLKILTYMAGTGLILLILVGIYMQLTGLTKEQKIREQYEETFNTVEFENAEVDYLKTENKFIVQSDRELTDEEKIRLKEDIANQLGENLAYFEVNGDLNINYIDGIVTTRSDNAEPPKINTPYETYSGETYDEGEITLD